MPTPKVVQQAEADFLRVVFLTGHVLEMAGAKIAHQAGKYYHVAKADAEDLIASGIARLDTVHEDLLKKEAEDRAAAAAGQKKSDSPAGGSADEKKATDAVQRFASPAPGVAEAGEGGK
jgi:hypothetical protein